MINDSCIENLRSFQEVIQELGNALYTSPLDVLSESTIGQHVRHVRRNEALAVCREWRLVKATKWS